MACTTRPIVSASMEPASAQHALPIMYKTSPAIKGRLRP